MQYIRLNNYNCTEKNISNTKYPDRMPYYAIRVEHVMHNSIKCDACNAHR